MVEWFRPGEHERAERVLSQLRALDIRHIRAGVSWAEWHTEQGGAWYDWLLPRLARDFEVLPCLVYTPPSLGIVPKCSAPPRDPKAFANFLDLFLTRYGRNFEWVELWNEPNNLNDWDWRLDPEWRTFCEMIGAAAYWAKQRGFKTVLAGMCPTDPNWLRIVCKGGVLAYIDAVGLHGFPGTWEHDWTGWDGKIAPVKGVLDAFGHRPEIWITEAGFSTWRHDHIGQIRTFLETLSAPVDRVYWYALQDLDEDLPSQEGFHVDDRHYHMGLLRADGTPSLLWRLLEAGGVEAVRGVERLARPAVRGAKPERPVVITGGAGFVGTNLAARLAEMGRDVVLFDSLARPGVEINAAWLEEEHGDRVTLELADIRDPYVVRSAVRDAAHVYHLAAQVAVTSSLIDPRTDFSVNVQGTMNLLEALRRSPSPPPVVFTSSNKVYGGLSGIDLVLRGARYEPRDPKLRERGIDESMPLDFQSPYGCSKGAADQYILDYARSFDLPATVFRMSCIYGPHQFGTEDQGWVAHFLISALQGRPINIFGNGRQVRDVLYVGDLVDAFLACQRSMDVLAGKAFNIGGGPGNAVSLLELVARMRALTQRPVALEFDDWRTGDQRYYVSDTTRFRTLTGWRPRTGIDTGLRALLRWLRWAEDGASESAMESQVMS